MDGEEKDRQEMRLRMGKKVASEIYAYMYIYTLEKTGRTVIEMLMKFLTCQNGKNPKF